MNTFMLGLSFFLLLGCNVPKDTVVRREFLVDKPSALIESLGVGEGDSDHAYYEIRYRLPQNPDLLFEVWLYQKQQDGKWVCIHKDGPKIAQQGNQAEAATDGS